MNFLFENIYAFTLWDVTFFYSILESDLILLIFWNAIDNLCIGFYSININYEKNRHQISFT